MFRARSAVAFSVKGFEHHRCSWFKIRSDSAVWTSQCADISHRTGHRSLASDAAALGEVKHVSLATAIAGVRMDKVLLNTPNPDATTVTNLQTIASSPATGAFTTRTACPNFQHCDSQHQWAPWKNGGDDGEGNTNVTPSTINCLGYSSEDLDYYISAVQQVQSEYPKPAVLSITGKAEEVIGMLEKIAKELDQERHPVLVEINLSCPNIPGKPPTSYDYDAMNTYLATIFSQGTHGLKIGVKTTPYFYDQQFDAAAAALNSFPDLNFVTCINTIGHGLVVDVDAETSLLPATYGGLGGPVTHATALANVHRLRQLLRQDIDIIGVGGVDSGRAAFAHLLCGASAVGLASALLTEGPGCFERIESELIEIMVDKGYSSIDEFRGKLKSM